MLFRGSWLHLSMLYIFHFHFTYVSIFVVGHKGDNVLSICLTLSNPHSWYIYVQVHFLICSLFLSFLYITSNHSIYKSHFNKFNSIQIQFNSTSSNTIMKCIQKISICILYCCCSWRSWSAMLLDDGFYQHLASWCSAKQVFKKCLMAYVRAAFILGSLRGQT